MLIEAHLGESHKLSRMDGALLHTQLDWLDLHLREQLD